MLRFDLARLMVDKCPEFAFFLPGPPEKISSGTRSENELATGFTILCPPAPYVTQITPILPVARA
ncbi:MAG TPA: hypothetical protein VN742_12005 [Candidatus Binataceae bacterium]|nr:hypothetical protein [Candidatus Binataceae bacterium]